MSRSEELRYKNIIDCLEKYSILKDAIPEISSYCKNKTNSEYIFDEVEGFIKFFVARGYDDNKSSITLNRFSNLILWMINQTKKEGRVFFFSSLIKRIVEYHVDISGKITEKSEQNDSFPLGIYFTLLEAMIATQVGIFNKFLNDFKCCLYGKEYFFALKVLSKYVPISINESVSLIRVIMDLVSSRPSLICEDSVFDELFSRILKNSSKLTPRMYLPLLGKLLFEYFDSLCVDFSTTIKPVLFLGEYFEVLHHFIVTNKQCGSCILVQFNIFYYIESYITICVDLLNGDGDLRDFLPNINEPLALVSYMKLNTDFVPDEATILKLPLDVFFNLITFTKKYDSICRERLRNSFPDISENFPLERVMEICPELLIDNVLNSENCDIILKLLENENSRRYILEFRHDDLKNILLTRFHIPLLSYYCLISDASNEDLSLFYSILRKGVYRSENYVVESFVSIVPMLTEHYADLQKIVFVIFSKLLKQNEKSCIWNMYKLHVYKLRMFKILVEFLCSEFSQETMKATAYHVFLDHPSTSDIRILYPYEFWRAIHNISNYIKKKGLLFDSDEQSFVKIEQEDRHMIGAHLYVFGETGEFDALCNSTNEDKDKFLNDISDDIIAIFCTDSKCKRNLTKDLLCFSKKSIVDMLIRSKMLPFIIMKILTNKNEAEKDFFNKRLVSIKKLLNENSPSDEYLWYKYATQILSYSIDRIVKPNSQLVEREMILETLSVAIEKFNFMNCIGNLTCLLSNALIYSDIREKCILFWLKYFSLHSEFSAESKKFFLQVSHSLVPYFNEYIDHISNLLRIFIIEKDVLRSSVDKLIYLPPFDEKPVTLVKNGVIDFLDSNKVRFSTENILDLLLSELKSPHPLYRNLILERINSLLKQEKIICYANVTNINNLKLSLLSETSLENIQLILKCFGYVDIKRCIQFSVDDFQNKIDDVSIARTIIEKYAFPLLPIHGNISSYVIQVSLKCIKLEELDEYVRNIVGFYKNTSYRSLGCVNKISYYESLFVNANEDTPLESCYSYFLNILLEGSIYDYIKEYACLADFSSSLSLYLIPIVCKFNFQISKINLNLVKKLWNMVLENYSKDSPKKTPLSHFYDILESLIEYKILPSTNRQLSGWDYLEIDDDSNLARMAYNCEKYIHSIYYINLIGYDDLKREDITTLRDCYMKLNMLDRAQSIVSNYPEYFSRLESLFEIDEILLDMNKNIDPSSLLKLGRFEKVLEEYANTGKPLRSCPVEGGSVLMSAFAVENWRTVTNLISNDWYSYDEKRNKSIEKSFYISISYILYHIKNKNYRESENIIGNEYRCILTSIKKNMINYNSLLPYIIKIKTLNEISNFIECIKSNQAWVDNLSNWVFSNTNESETLITTGIICLTLSGLNVVDETVKSNEKAGIWLRIAQSFRKSGDLLSSRMFLARANKISTNNQFDTEILIELAKNKWARENNSEAVKILDSVLQIEHLKDDIRGEATYLKSKWSYILNSENINNIIDLYTESIKFLSDSSKANYRIAIMLDNHIMQIAAEKKNFHIKSGEEYTSVGTQRVPGESFYKSKMEKIPNTIKTYVPIVIKSYINVVLYSEGRSKEVIPRLLSIIFDFGSRLGEYKFGKHMENLILEKITGEAKLLDKIPDKVCLNFISQIISRNVVEKLRIYIYKLIKKSITVSFDLSFWHIIFLYNSKNKNDKFYSIINGVKKIFGSQIDSQFDEKIAKFVSITKSIISIISLGSQQSNDSDNKKFDIPDEIISSFNNCNIICPTRYEFDTVSDYPSVIESLSSDIKVMDSLQRPVKIELKSKNGKKYNFLCKKDDDLRKDMRMMDFCAFVNEIYKQSRICSHKLTDMVIFSVICLSEEYGIIEWVQKSECLYDVLSSLYSSMNLTIDMSEISERLNSSESTQRNLLKENLKNYLDIYPPVLRLWFFDKFKSPSSWFESRRIYTSSTATWSIVGYIIGLGDRHPKNILFSSETGSVFHVDFCCLFDKGKDIPGVREQVPFRMTQNIVDALGPVGTEEAFKGLAILVIDTLKSKVDQLISVLNTFHNDPLLEWENLGNRTPEMIIHEVKNRIIGRKDDILTTQSSEYVVSSLIQEATSLDNLSKMFYGWMPFF